MCLSQFSSDINELEIKLAIGKISDYKITQEYSTITLSHSNMINYSSFPGHVCYGMGT